MVEKLRIPKNPKNRADMKKQMSFSWSGRETFSSKHEEKEEKRKIYVITVLKFVVRHSGS